MHQPATTPLLYPPGSSWRLNSVKTTHTIHLPASLDVDSVTQLYSALAPYVDRAEPVVLDARDVARAHTAVLQVLGSFVRIRAMAGWSTRWYAPSPFLCEVAMSLGLAEALRLPFERDDFCRTGEWPAC